MSPIESATALARTEESTITPMSLIQSAIMQGAGIDTIERLAKLQREMVEYDAKVAWNDAMERCQALMRPISADATNPQTKSRYASYAQLDRALRPIYSKEKFSLSFNTTDSPLPDHVRVLCDVARGGHIRPYQIDIPADGKGAKGGDVMTKTHATGAATSYGMRYLLKMIFNVAVGESDSDGNTGAHIPEEKVVEHLTWMEDAQDIAALQKIFVEVYKAAQAAGDKDAMYQYIKVKDDRKKALNAAH